MEQQKWYQIELYFGLYDLEELQDVHPFKETVNKITELMGDCTIIPCIGSCNHSIGIRITMNSLKVIKFTNKNPDDLLEIYIRELKKFFNQECIITNITECTNLQFN